MKMNDDAPSNGARIARAHRVTGAARARGMFAIDPVFAVYAFFAARLVYDVHGARIRAEYVLITRKIRAFHRRVAERLAAPTSVADALRELGDVNVALEALASAACGVRPREGWRYRATLGASAASATRLLRRVSRAGEDVGVDFEEVPCGGGAMREGRRRWRAESYGYVAAEDRAGEDGVTDDGTSDDGEESFEMVHVVRRASLDVFYHALKPMIQQLAVDYATERGGGGEVSTSSRTAVDERDDVDREDDEECSICMDNKLQVVVNCGHAFCEECHTRWLRVSMSCPICRETLPPPRRDECDASFSLIDFDDVRDALRRPRRRDLGDIARDWREDTQGEILDDEHDELHARGENLLRRIRALPEAAEQSAFWALRGRLAHRHIA
jgi:hypothetical protein